MRYPCSLCPPIHLTAAPNPRAYLCIPAVQGKGSKTKPKKRGRGGGRRSMKWRKCRGEEGWKLGGHRWILVGVAGSTWSIRHGSNSALLILGSGLRGHDLVHYLRWTYIDFAHPHTMLPNEPLQSRSFPSLKCQPVVLGICNCYVCRLARPIKRTFTIPCSILLL